MVIPKGGWNWNQQEPNSPWVWKVNHDRDVFMISAVWQWHLRGGRVEDKNWSQLHHATTMPTSHGIATDPNHPSAFHLRELDDTERSSTWSLHSLKTGCTLSRCGRNTTVAPAILTSTVLGVPSPCMSQHYSSHNQEPSVDKLSGVV